MPLSFAHSHPSDNWRISVRGTTNMGRDTYEQGQYRFHDGGVPYASDNFAWGPDGGFGIIMFADRRGFAICPVKAEIAEKLAPQQAAAGAGLGIDMQDPCPGAPAIATTQGPTVRAHLDGGFDDTDRWREVGAGVRVAAGLAGEPTSGPVLLLLDGAPGAEVLPARSMGTEVIVAPVSGSVDAAGTVLGQGDVRLEEGGARAPGVGRGPRRCPGGRHRRRPPRRCGPPSPRAGRRSARRRGSRRSSTTSRASSPCAARPTPASRRGRSIAADEAGESWYFYT